MTTWRMKREKMSRRKEKRKKYSKAKNRIIRHSNGGKIKVVRKGRKSDEEE